VIPEPVYQWGERTSLQWLRPAAGRSAGITLTGTGKNALGSAIRLLSLKSLTAMHLDETVTLTLKVDEAIVLGCFLSRELWNQGGERLTGCIEHPAETHALHSLLQELVPTLVQAGGPHAEENENTARASLISRYT
jgi:hypothetical protein